MSNKSNPSKLLSGLNDYSGLVMVVSMILATVVFFVNVDASLSRIVQEQETTKQYIIESTRVMDRLVITLENIDRKLERK